MSINIQKRDLVIPGEVLASGNYISGSNTVKEGEEILATKVGLADIASNRISVVALEGCYIPSVDDTVVGRVRDIGLSGWDVDIDAPYHAMLPVSEAVDRRKEHVRRDLSNILSVGDMIISKIIAFDRTRDPLLTIRGQGLGRITSGRIIKISSSKVPRLIGRKGSMISMIKKETESQIIVGQNGRILVSSKSPPKEQVAIAAIYKIEREAHLNGLTDRVRETIRRNKKDGT
jgi:exosome complex component RRP4